MKGAKNRRLMSREVTAFLVDKLDAHQKVILPGLGTLRLVWRKGRPVRHPATGVIYEIPARVSLAFRPARPRAGRKPASPEVST